MGNNRNFIIAIALSIVVLFAWQYFVAQPQIERAQQDAANQVAASEPLAPAGQLDGGAAVVPQIIAETREEAIGETARIPIETPSLTGSINLVGARIDDLSLNDYRVTIEDGSPNVVLLSPANGPGGYFAEFGWLGGAGVAAPGSATVWTAPAGAVLTPETPVTLTYDNGAGLVFTRIVSVDAEYLFTVADSVANTGEAAATLTPYGRVTRLGEPESRGFFILHEGMIGFLGDDGLVDVDYAVLEGEPRQDYTGAPGGWLGITDKYWATALIPDRDDAFSASFRRPTEGGVRYQADYAGAAVSVAPGATAETTNRLFAGAKEVAVVDGYDSALGLQRFELLVDWGMFYFITKPMFHMLDWFYRLIGNFGVAILLVTVVIKLLFFPLANRSYRSMASMRKVGPQLTAIRERYKDDRAKQQQMMMELYRKEKINPIAGCWPILIQIPVFFALYKVLYVTIEMRHQPFFGWIQDLSAPDPTSFINLFGLLPFEAPAIIMIGVWPILMGITMWVQMRLNPQTPGAPQWIFHLLPIVFTFMLSSFPAGLVIYWTWNNLLSIAQQSFIMRRHGVKVDLLGNIRASFRRKPKVPAAANSDSKAK
ncbi:MAG: membrane protein insertase YidC [Bauldia sp.]|nr:membrane protein insertase YidC [Bauldia sp.]